VGLQESFFRVVQFVLGRQQTIYIGFAKGRAVTQRRRSRVCRGKPCMARWYRELHRIEGGVPVSGRLRNYSQLFARLFCRRSVENRRSGCPGDCLDTANALESIAQTMALAFPSVETEGRGAGVSISVSVCGSRRRAGERKFGPVGPNENASYTLYWRSHSVSTKYIVPFQ